MRLLRETEREDLEIQIEFLIGHSFDSTERKVMGRNKDQKGVIF